ncbi:MAG: RluA family pseudouridine synthase [Anaerolineae bacterium]
MTDNGRPRVSQTPGGGPGIFTWTADDLPAGDRPRLDRYLVRRFPQLSRSGIQRLIVEGQVLVDGRLARASQRVMAGQKVWVCIPPPQEDTLTAEGRPLDILFEDQDILVIHKAAGEVVHPSAGHREGTLVQAILAHCSDLTGVGGRLRPGIVHRLDKDTSGVLLVAKNDWAFRRLQSQFKARQVRKTYLALVEGRVKNPVGCIEAPVGRDPRSRKRMAVVPDGREAVTRYRLLRCVGDCSLLMVQPLTGRTHQIRVHLAFIGHPVAGDPVYGNKRSALLAPRQFLHAWCLGFHHPASDEWVEFRAPLPTDLRLALRDVMGAGAG